MATNWLLNVTILNQFSELKTDHCEKSYKNGLVILAFFMPCVRVTAKISLLKIVVCKTSVNSPELPI